jgi:hypothetical protein
VLSGNLRLLIGMVRANRPWRPADNFGWVRLSAVAVGSVVATAVTLVVGAEMWERPGSRRVRKQVALFNLATAATVLIGILTLCLALFLLALTGALLLGVPALFAERLGHPVRPSDYLEPAWLISSLATVGGALGAGLESDESVRQAAYSYRPDRVPTEPTPA